ncbi:branched-chain amino acid ABC transporter permease [Phaeobacter italicus]|uniref:branched-chain amino acid ABC transporter permease n=1 Tax=Phaeobacter italicus TaxID=481446 RepID=UPI002FDB1E24
MQNKLTFWIATSVPVALLLVILATISWPEWLEAILLSRKAFFSALLNGLSVAGLYFIVAAGFSLIFGLMRNVNLAHGAMYLFGAYVGYEIVGVTGSWVLAAIGATLCVGALGIILQLFVFRHIEKDEIRQTLVSIGLAILLGDLMMGIWGGQTYQIPVPELFKGAVKLPIVTAVRSSGDIVQLSYPIYRLAIIGMAIVIGFGLYGLLNRTRIGVMVRAGVDDRMMLMACGVNVEIVFVAIFALGAGLAGLAGLIGGAALSVSPGEDLRYLLASLVVVIVGGMGSIGGAAIGAVLVGLTEQLGLVYFPAYSAVITFLIMVVTLMVRPQGLMGGRQ